MIVVKADDDGTAPEIAVAGPCEVERITAGQVRVSYYTVIHGRKRVAAHLVWDWEIFRSAYAVYAGVLEEIEKSAPANGDEAPPVLLVRAH